MRKKSYLTLTLGCLVILAACGDSDPVRTEGDPPEFGVMELVELRGAYAFGGTTPEPPPPGRTTAFSFPENIAGFRELRLEISGNWTQALVELTHAYGTKDTMVHFVGLTVQLTVDQMEETIFLAQIVPPHGEPFGLHETFKACCPLEGLDPLLFVGAEVTAKLFCEATLAPNARVLTDAGGMLADIRLVAVDAERAPWP